MKKLLMLLVLGLSLSLVACENNEVEEEGDEIEMNEDMNEDMEEDVDVEEEVPADTMTQDSM